jgi:diguanylate cyclase (GGDEF)-like protein
VIGPLHEARRLTLERLGGATEFETPPSAGPDAPSARATSHPIEPSVQRFPRAALSAQARGSFERVHRLLRLGDPYLSSDPRQPNARVGLIEQLNLAGRDVLGASALRFVPISGAGSEAEAFVDNVLAREARAHPELVFYCADTRALFGPLDSRRREVRGLALTAVCAGDGQPLGLIEVSTRERHPFGAADLALIAMLADYCAGVLERASKIEKLVFIDPMTSAYNRSYFDLEVQNEMARARRESSSLALCIVDIDNFKQFNSSYGYEGGNQVLVHVAQSLKRAVRPFDTVARWGGEEFAVLLTAPVQAADVVTVSERLRTMVERQDVTIPGLDGATRQVRVTVSIGVALFPDHESTAPDLWRAANQALLEAKRPPKNRVVFYSRPG